MRGEHGIRRVFGHFGRGYVHVEHPEVVDQKRTVEAPHDLAGPFAFDAHDHAVGRHEILDRSPLLEKFGIRGHVERNLLAACGQLLADRGLDFLRRPDRNGAFRYENGIFADVAAEGPRHIQHVAQVGRSVLVGRRADGRKDHLDLIETGGEVRREVQASRLCVAAHEFFEPGFVDRYNAAAEGFDLLRVGVHTGDVEPHFCETCARHEPHVTRSDDSYSHKSGALG